MIANFLTSTLFLSTPSARRATAVNSHGAGAVRISIHALREEGDAACTAQSSFITEISIHALREEGDVPRRLLFHAYVRISIHALREEGDVSLVLPDSENC